MVENVFKEFNFNDSMDPDTLEFIFESAWDTLKGLYPDKQLDACDCFCIDVLSDTINAEDGFNSRLVYVTGLLGDRPVLQNIETKEIVPIKLNKERWYADIV